MDKIEEKIKKILNKIKNNDYMFMAAAFAAAALLFAVSFYSANDGIKFIYGGF